MNGRDAYSEELLSAYLDGKVTDEERRHVEQGLRDSSQYRRKLQALHAVNERLQHLPRYRLSRGAASRILDAVDTAADTARSAEDLEAYFDGQLSEAERERVEQQLQQNPAQHEMLDRLDHLHEQFARLPKYQLGDAFADRVMDRIGQHDASGVSPRSPSAEPSRPARRVAWRRTVWAVVALASAVLLMFLLSGVDRHDLRLAGPDRPVEAVLPAPDVEPVAPESPSAPVDPQWTLVSSIGRNNRQLVLVFELSLTEEGVEQAAFANLLHRHRIGFQDTFPVGPRDQANLLKHRFLDDVQLVEEDRDDLDPVELYLVRTTGRTADAIYRDLVARPSGFGSFFLNLTSRDAQDRVLHRLCEATGIQDEVGQAVQLLANFGILSRSARNLGAFGTIRWVDPELLKQGSQGAADDLPVEAPPPPAEHEGDFGCEILFVIRHLR